jgi:phage I-like protein
MTLLKTLHLKAVLAELPEGQIPTEFRIFKAGVNTSLKGDFIFDEESAKSVMEFYASHGTELHLDYEHASAYEGKDTPKGAPAAGWFVPEVRNGELWATNVRWTPPAAEMLKNREYRYFSPTFEATKDENRVAVLISVALTNLPALDKLDTLIAAKGGEKKETPMTPEEMKALLSDAMKPFAERMDKLEAKAKAKDDEGDDKDEDEDDEEEEMKATSKAKALIDAAVGTKLTPAEGKDMHARLTAKTIDADYVEAFLSAKGVEFKPTATEPGKETKTVSFGFAKTEGVEKMSKKPEELEATTIAILKAQGKTDAEIEQVAASWAATKSRIAPFTREGSNLKVPTFTVGARGVNEL